MSEAIIWGAIAAAVLVGVVVARKKIKETAVVRSANEAESVGSSALDTTEREAPDYQNIINAYGELLEEDPPSSSLLYDVNLLPFSKESIKEACLWAIKQTNDNAMLQALKFSYLRLANYQENIQEALQEKSIKPYYGVVDPDTIDMEKYREWLQFHQERMPVVDKEMESLGEELREIA